MFVNLKYTFGLIILPVFFYSQTLHLKPGTWMPEEFVKMLKDTSEVMLSGPIEPIVSIEISDNEVFIEGPEGDPKPVKFIKKSSNRYELRDLHVQHKDSKLHKKRLTKYFLFNKGDYLVFQTIRVLDTISINFLREINGYRFKNSTDAIVRSSFQGHYRLENERITILSNGSILGSSRWSTFSLLREGQFSVDSDRKVCHLISILENGKELSFAMKIDKNKCSFYNYKTNGYSNYKLQLASKPEFELIKILK
jgi:hypothetical protein